MPMGFGSWDEDNDISSFQCDSHKRYNEYLLLTINSQISKIKSNQARLPNESFSNWQNRLRELEGKFLALEWVKQQLRWSM